MFVGTWYLIDKSRALIFWTRAKTFADCTLKNVLQKVFRDLADIVQYSSYLKDIFQ
jgi:hypothetical protein